MTDLRSHSALAATANEPFWPANHGEKALLGLPSADSMLAQLRAAVDAHHAGLSLPGIEARNDALDHRAGRLEALRFAASIHSSSDAVDLELLVRESLRSFQFGDAAGVHLGGAPIWLRVASARSLLLALHELVTNAIKFGALGGAWPRSALQVAWRRDAGGATLLWRETGVPVLRPAEQSAHGFGCTFLQQILPACCGAVVQFNLLPGGAACSIHFPETSLFIDRC